MSDVLADDVSTWEVVDRIPTGDLAALRGEVVDLGAMSLDELATYANARYADAEREREKAEQHISAGVAHALDVGAALLAARERIGEAQEWSSWFETNATFDYWIAARYMRFAYYRDQLLGHEGRITMKTAHELLAGLPPIPRLPGKNKTPDDVVVQIKSLVKEGMPKKDVAELLGVHPRTVTFYTSPTARSNQMRGQRRRKAKARAAAAALREKERAAAAKKVGGSSAEAYSLIRRSAAELDRALGDAESEAVRAALRTALAAVHKAEDHISQAIRKAS